MPQSGFSAKTVFVPVHHVAEGQAQEAKVVLRMESPEPAIYPKQTPELDVEIDIQYRAMEALHRTGAVPLAPLIGYEADPQILFEPDCARRLEICSGRTCARRGGARLIRQARQGLGIELFETTSEAALRLEPFRCFGQCARAPNIRLDGVVQGAMTEKRFGALLGLLGRVRS